MKIIHLSIFTSAIALTASPAISLADNNQNGFFVNGGIGSSMVDAPPSHTYPYGSFNDSSDAYDLNIGYRWGWFGVELGYVDPSRFHITQTGFPGESSYELEARLHGITAGINAHYDFTRHWYVSGRAGVFQWRGSEGYYTGFNDIGNGAPLVASNSDSKTDWYAGAGFGYDFSQHFGIGISYDYYKATSSSHYIDLTNHIWSATAEYRF